MVNELECKIKEILNKKNWPTLILSVYLSISAKDSPTNLQLLTLFHSLLHNLPDGERKVFKKEIQLIEESIHSLTDTRGKKSFIYFVGENTFEHINLNLHLNPYGRVGLTPYLLPIKLIEKELPKTLVIIADRQKLRLITIYLNEIENEVGLWETKVPPIIKAKKVQYGKYDKIEKHIKNHFDKHLETLSSFIENYYLNKNIQKVILGGSQEVFDNCERILPKKLLSLLSEKFVSSVDISNDEILQRYLGIEQKEHPHYFLLT